MKIAAMMSVAVLLTGSAVCAFETKTNGPPRNTVVLDNDNILPDRLTVSPKELVVFENHSVHPMTVAFTDPSDLRERLPKLLERPGEETAGAGLNFRWNADKLTAVLPPGKAAQLGPLPPGHYAFTVANVDARAGAEKGQGGSLSEKGTIDVKGDATH